KDHTGAPRFVEKNNRIQEVWASCNPSNEKCDGGSLRNNEIRCYWKSTNDNDRIDLEWEGLSCTNWVRARYGENTIMEYWEDPEKCRETMTRVIIEAMVNKLPKEWFSRVSKDKDDLEGIIDYLEPTLYDGFINPDDEAYKQRRNKLLGMPYTEPPPILKEAEIIRYNLGAGEDPITMRHLLRPARLIIMCELGDKELARRWR
ncbi:hypothetical protein Tco_1514677, partial [Tanacetum coccineum]